MMRWLSIVGVQEDGLDGLSPAARAVLAGAAVLVGGRRLLDLIPDSDAERIPWTTTEATVAAILARRGRPTVVVATGDPMNFGLGATLARAVLPEEMLVIPAPSAFTLAAARMGWALQDCLQLTAHGRPVEAVLPHVCTGRKMLILATDGDTPRQVAALLTRAGFGASRVAALAHMGGPRECRFDDMAGGWSHANVPALNVVAVECRHSARAPLRGSTPGLPDDAFEHDGQITKRDVRAATVSALAPWPGALLWDVGAGSGSVAIECMRASSCSAIAVERDPARVARIGRNAVALGVPGLEVVEGGAPDVLADLPDPDLIFLGGGVSVPGLLETCWDRTGVRLVANAVTLEAEAALLAFRARFGGELTRLQVAHPKAIGGMTVWEPLAPVTRLVAEKP